MELNEYLNEQAAYLNAQAAVIGSLLIEPEKLSGEIFRRVRDSDFSNPT